VARPDPRYSDVIGDTQPVSGNSTSTAVTVDVAGTDAAARLRVRHALKDRSDVEIRVSASLDEVLSATVAADVIICYCDAVTACELDAFKRMKRESLETLVIAVCGVADARDARRLLDSGVDGFVLAVDIAKALPVTVAALLAGQTSVPRQLGACLQKASLSTRERQILGMVVMGFSNGEIGARMFLAESTVKSHLSSAYTKLGARSRNEAVDMILDPHGSLGTGVLATTSGVERRAA
jgi:DNA-binding NarL/FixJ family response regulator